MAIVIELISQSDGIHHLLFGQDSNKTGSFKIQMYITKYGARAVDWLQSLSLGMVSFMGGDVWIHNSDDVPRANFFGEQKDVKVGVVVNEQSNVVKLLDYIGVFSDGKWEVESVIIPATINHPNGMYSRIPKERFKKREGVFRSEFLRNMKTSGSTIKTIEAISGEPLRGEHAYVILKNTDTSEIKLFKVEVGLTTSKA